MSFRIIVASGALGNPVNQGFKKPDDGLQGSSGNTTRSNLRSSTRTDTKPHTHKSQKLYTKHTRRRISACQPLVPLSSKSVGVCASARQQRRATRKLSSTISLLNRQTQSKGVPRLLSKYCYPPSPSARLSPGSLLSQARQYIELETVLFGRRRFVMDFILDHEARLSDMTGEENYPQGSAAEHGQSLFQQDGRHHFFSDDQRPNTYWNNRTSIWGDTRLVGNAWTSFPDSGERSTASWGSMLNDETGIVVAS